MSKRIKTLNRRYNALAYEINKEDALIKVFALSCGLTFKKPDDFQERFLQTASLIEENLSVFKSACNHVDIVYTILDFLHTISMKLMYNECNVDYIYIIYMMYIVCEEYEIPTFLKTALINNSRLAFADEHYKRLISNYIYEMIVFEDSDFYAIISYLKITPFFLLKIKKIFVQEPIKQKFLWFIEKYFKNFYTYMDSLISIFHTKEELLLCFPHTYRKRPTNLHMVSIWSENITAAKILATKLNTDITFINTHLEFCANITFSYKWMIDHSVFEMFEYIIKFEYDGGYKLNPDKYTGSIYNLFYNGAWQMPVKDKYWTYNGNTYAYATNEDMLRCIKSAEQASKSWSILSFESRKTIVENLASTLECNGKFLLANTVSSWIMLTKANHKLQYQEERLEMTCNIKPNYIVSISDKDEAKLFGHLTYNLIFGNCVIVLCNEYSATLAPYFNMFLTAEIPPGVINLLSNKHMSYHDDDKCPLKNDSKKMLNYCTSKNHIILLLK